MTYFKFVREYTLIRGCTLFDYIFRSDVFGKFHNELYNFIYVTVQNKETYDIFSFNIMRADGWSAVEELPIGEYCIVEGGIINDWSRRFPVEYKHFKVDLSYKTVVRFNCGSVETSNSIIYTTPFESFSDNNKLFENSPSNKATQHITVPANSNNNSNSDTPSVVRFIPVVVIILAIIWYVYRKKKSLDQDDN